MLDVSPTYQDVADRRPAKTGASGLASGLVISILFWIGLALGVYIAL